MKERAKDGRRWRIGELARAAGVTVRTLHHYERIGLLLPPSRNEGDQRLYDESDIRRLYRVCALRDLGLSLADIARSLQQDRTALRDVLRDHRARIATEIERLEGLRSLLDHACTQAEPDLKADDVLATIEAMSRVIRRGKARQNAGEVPADDETRWRVLGERLRACMSAGEAPSAARPHAVAREALARIAEFAGGDHETLEALAYLRRAVSVQNLVGLDTALLRYLDQALTSLQEKESKTNVERTDREKRGTGATRRGLGTAR